MDFLKKCNHSQVLTEKNGPFPDFSLLKLPFLRLHISTLAHVIVTLPPDPDWFWSMNKQEKPFFALRVDTPDLTKASKGMNGIRDEEFTQII